MNRSTFKHLFLQNPMFAEVQRAKRSLLSEHNWRGGQLAVRLLIAVFYLFLLVMTMSFVDDIEPFLVMYIMLGLATIVLPSTLHGAIAGEREQRALDMLLVAPVTPGQIVVGKFAKALLTIGLLAVFIGLPAMFIELVHQTSSSYSQNYYRMESNGFVGYFSSLTLVVVTSLMIGAITMWVSSKTKSKAGAMMGTIGALFVLFIVVPSIGGVITFVLPGVSEVLTNTSPFSLLYWAYMGVSDNYGYSSGYMYEAQAQSAFYLLPTMIAMALLTVLFLVLATTNLEKIALGRTD
jgi:ABC-type transport system involved in multi-copper enzyme maturation permease subunit